MIRIARLEDSDQIAKIQVAGWKTTYKGIVPKVFLDSMNWEERTPIWKQIVSTQTVYVAENQDNKIIGFCHAGKGNTQDYPNFAGELYSLYILKDYQRKGIGKQLFMSVIEDFRGRDIHSCMVKVLEKNQSKYFYEFLNAEYVDKIEVEIAGEKLSELVYGWQDLRQINT